jgi:hypothetical protein
MHFTPVSFESKLKKPNAPVVNPERVRLRPPESGVPAEFNIGIPKIIFNLLAEQTGPLRK